jgi:hypothetical protein
MFFCVVDANQQWNWFSVRLAQRLYNTTLVIFGIVEFSVEGSRGKLVLI